jgi:hypothetical protein
MPIVIDGSQVRVECDRRDYADVILPIFAELGSRAELRVVDDDDTMHAGGGWEAITVLADHAAVAPLLAAAAVAGGIAAGEVVKEMTKDAYKAVKAAIPKCISAAKKQIPSFHRLRTTDQLVRESFLGIRIYVLPSELCKPSDRVSLDIRLDSSRRDSIVLPDGVVNEALWLFEKRLAPLLIRAINGLRFA